MKFYKILPKIQTNLFFGRVITYYTIGCIGSDMSDMSVNNEVHGISQLNGLSASLVALVSQIITDR